MRTPRVEEGTTLRRLATWRSRQSDLPLVAARSGAADPWYFVADEILVNSRDVEAVTELERLGGVATEEAALPPAPDYLERRREVDLHQAPRTTVVHFPDRPRSDRAPRESPYDAEVEATVVSSTAGAHIAGLAAALRAEGRRVGLNVVGQPFSMPLAAPTEGSGLAYPASPLQWQAFAGRSRVADAWHLVESVRQVRGGSPVWVAISDAGFWVDGAGVPQVAPGQPVSDFGAGVLQWNLDNEGQRVPNGTTSFHGNQVASAAFAAVGNAAGAAGSGGTIAFPAFFHSGRTAERAMRAAKLCVWWGIDVLNFSWGFWGQSEFWFDTDTWDETFDWAGANGLVVIAAAGNSTLDLPDDENIRPATRTPRTLTVGALDTNDNARGSSNFGSSVWLWAPGTAIPVAPDGGALGGSTVSGTSFAAPVVAGVAAMMRYCNPSLSADDVRRLLIETAWPGSGRVSRGLDAYAAVWAALQRALPDSDEPNNMPGNARALLPVGPGNTLAPSPTAISALSSGTDRDYWSFSTDRLRTVTVTVDWYDRIANLSAYVELVGAGGAIVDLTTIVTAGRRALSGLLPAGSYLVRVQGSGPTAYRLMVAVRDAALAPDIFEPNDSFDTATRLAFEATTTPWTLLRRWGPGSYAATLHRHSAVLGWTFVNDDYYRLDVPASSVFRLPTMRITDSDELLHVTLYDAARSPIQDWPAVRQVPIRPPAESVCYVRVSGARQSRYWFRVGLDVDKDALPGPWQEELTVIPKWWVDPPPLRLVERVSHLAVDLGPAELEDTRIAFLAAAAAVGAESDAALDGVRLDLLDGEGVHLRGAEIRDGRHLLDVGGLEPGTYVLRATVGDDTGEQRLADVPALTLRAVPPV